MGPIRIFIEYFFKKKWLGLLVVLSLVIGTGISTFYRGALSPKQRTDLTVYLKAAEMIREGRPGHLYGIETARHWHYVYTPLLAILLAPFTGLPLGVNVLLAYLVSIAALGIVFFLSRSLSDPPKNSSWKIVLAGIFCLPLFLNTLSRAQLGIISLFFSVLILSGYLRNWKITTGLCLAFIVTLKISPLGFLFFFFLFKKEWKILLSALAGILVFCFIVPSCVIGAEVNWNLLLAWRELMAAGSSDGAHNSYLWNELFTPFAHDNQSLYAVVTRLVWPSQEKFVIASNTVVRILTSGINIALLGLLFWGRIPARPAHQQDRVRLTAEFSLYPMLMLFASPVTQNHHYTSLYLLLFAALLLLDRQPRNSPPRLWLLMALWTCACSIFLNYVIIPLSFAGTLLWGSLFLWGVVLLQIKINADKS